MASTRLGLLLETVAPPAREPKQVGPTRVQVRGSPADRSRVTRPIMRPFIGQHFSTACQVYLKQPDHLLHRARRETSIHR